MMADNDYVHENCGAVVEALTIFGQVIVDLLTDDNDAVLGLDI